ncbi:hypothetical protein GH714_035408 [Hevea brasiliensis]|uniref:EF-hand domain-containing protein n=1 Tax=Hevea brasiliensis TaxID=3981 RepID=A0A6A6KMX3_HEVBR|nr:hypothetical protein GH714_035408 [Hevea brasiliensis]
MSGYPHPPSGYGYGVPPPPQPYGASPQYGAPAPAQPYGAPSAPYGAPYAPPAGDKPPKDKPHSSAPAYAHGGYPRRLLVEPSTRGARNRLKGGHLGKQRRATSTRHNEAPGPKEFTSVFYSLQNWRAIFERFDRDRSGKIDSNELREALYSLGYAVSPVVLDLLVSKFDKSGGKNRAIEYDNFIECCLTVKGLTEKFKEKDSSYSGSATFTYEAIFERFDGDVSGKIDSNELREALYSLGFAVSPVVLDLLVYKFDKSGGKNKAIEYDNFIECCLTVKSLTEKFKEKDSSYSGSATFTYESFMLTVLPFLIA